MIPCRMTSSLFGEGNFQLTRSKENKNKNPAIAHHARTLDFF
jgi:hypothetical protein